MSEAKAREQQPTSARSSRRTLLAWTTAVAACVGLLLVWGRPLCLRLSPTADEPGHLAAGLSTWDHGDYRLSTGNLFLTQKWAAAPLWMHGVRPPPEADREQLGWNPLLVGEEMLYFSGKSPEQLLTPARFMTLAAAIAGAVLAAAWAARIGGAAAGAACALLIATSPVILANAVLVTTDMGSAVGLVGTLGAYCWMLEEGSFAAAALAGLFAGMLALCKFSAPAAAVAGLAILAWELRRGHFGGRGLRLWVLHLVMFAVAWVTIWAFFGFEFRPGGYAYLDALASTGFGGPADSLLSHAVSRIDALRLLPEPFLRECLIFGSMIQPRPGYLLGSFHIGGSWMFFPVAFAVKSTVASLAALGAFALLPKAPNHESPTRSSVPIAVGFVSFLVLSMATPLNIGVRHVLPLFFFGCILGGLGIARLAERGLKMRGLAWALAALALLEGTSARSRPLAWFNALSGGSMNGYRILVDSSLDWGGDLQELSGWLASLRQSEPSSRVYVSLAGPPGRDHQGLPVRDMVTALEKGTVQPGYFVYSATRLVGGPVDIYGTWTAGMQDRFDREVQGRWSSGLGHDRANLAAAKLAAYCRSRTADLRIGPVFFVFRLGESELEKALGPRSSGPPPPG